MESNGLLITAAARALAAGDLLGALKRVALRDDPPALALRGIAMAQLGDFDRAKVLLRRAARAFGPREAVARARCVVAEAEIALVSRDLGWPAKTLDAARATLEAHGDPINAAHARTLELRRLLLIGHLDEAEQVLAGVDPAPLPAALRANHELVVAGIALRRLNTKTARAALARAGACGARRRHSGADRRGRKRIAGAGRARGAAGDAGRPAAPSGSRTSRRCSASKALVVDACRHAVRDAGTVVSLARRPVLFALARALGEAWPADVPRATLIARAFRGRHADESHRARLRVEIGRLRSALRKLADVSATSQGLRWCRGAIARSSSWRGPSRRSMRKCWPSWPMARSWSSSALALALGASQRTVQRALDALAAAGKVQSFGLGRARRWLSQPVPGFTTTLLLPGPLPSD